MIDDKYRIGNFINKLRKEKNMTQSELGRILGVTNKAVSKWEVGENTPDSSLFPIIAKVLGVTVDELFRGERNKDYRASRNPKIDYYNAVERLRLDARIIFIIFVAYILYFLIFFMIKPIKWSNEYNNDVKILFNVFIPVFIYLISSGIYAIINIQEIIINDFSRKKKIIYIVLMILLFFILLLPLFIARVIIVRKKRKKYIDYERRSNI